MKGYVVIIPAYNEERLITKCIESVYKCAVRGTHLLRAVIVCANGCTDLTEKKVKDLQKSFSNLELITCRHGYLNAINRLFLHCGKYFDAAVVKIDADSNLADNAISILLDELTDHPRLVVVGGQPKPRTVRTTKIKQIISEILNCRAQYPMSEISKKDVARYHCFAKKYTQIMVTIDWELKSKIYFHGRFWAVRSPSSWIIPKKAIGDDVYLSALILTRYGAGTIRVRYDSICYFEPIVSVWHHWKTYRRIKADKDMLARSEELKWYIEESRTKLHWQYIFKLPEKKIIYFILYRCLVFLENLSYVFIPYRSEFWTYESKKVLNENSHT